MDRNSVAERTAILLGAATAGVLLTTPSAVAVPSFARQTGLSCEACHTVFPELTHFGRMFKANGYTLTSLPQVQGMTPEKEQRLSLNQLPPLSLMVQLSDTQLAKSLPDSPGLKGAAQNGTVSFPQQVSIFYAGKIAPQLGVFGQLTYSNSSGTVQIDNTDFRFADVVVLPDQKPLIYGLSLNNNPSVQDLWNGSPAFSYPYQSSNANVAPLAHTAIDGTFAQTIAGLSAYALWKESLYAEAGVYRSAKQGFANPITGAAGPLDGTASNVVQGVAPYWRVAYEQQWSQQSLEIGAYGATFKLLPGAASTTAPTSLQGPTNRFQDVAEDVQYQFLGDNHIFSMAATHIHESQTLDASFLSGNSANPKDTLSTFRVTGTYFYRRKWGGSAGYFSTTGSTDPGLYGIGSSPGVTTSANGSPNTTGWIAEANYVPWLNVKLSLQYTGYTRFNGGGTNYDGYGRNARDNDTVYIATWFAY
ncbi:MAG: cytochrome C [Steroidobacteraceae bacterium]